MKEFLANIEDFYDTYDNQLIWAMKKYKTNHNESYNEDRYVGLQVVLLLLWYGVSIEKMCEIKLKDVSYKGIKGYDIEFDDRTLDLFMQYKQMTGIYYNSSKDGTVFQLYKQDTFIRTVSSAGERGGNDISKDKIVNLIFKMLLVEKEDKDIKTLFMPSYIYPNGACAYVYEHIDDKVNKYTVGKLAKEFGYTFEAPTAEATFLKKYKKYAAFRQEWEQEHPQQEELKQEPEQEVEQEPMQENIELPTEQTESDNLVKFMDTLRTMPKPEPDVDVCLNMIEGLKTSILLISNQIDTLEAVLRNMKK